ncbi:CCGSCS motif protein [Vibrio genomosp. F6]|uniref:CCGSCS motif protein n=1 Tax=Vibrio genomosp. F6 TaxID=723172 RepID=UPI0010BD52DA|nr:CCGSCS motif protein [Vibrio genomosp. F6]TKF21330.1 CCGSCS motif protein [Vibrio genomosp. F6]
MALSFKKIFKGNKEETEQVKVTTEAASSENAATEDKTQETSGDKIKHNTPSGCCGSCS